MKTSCNIMHWYNVLHNFIIMNDITTTKLKWIGAGWKQAEGRSLSVCGLIQQGIQIPLMLKLVIVFHTEIYRQWIQGIHLKNVYSPFSASRVLRALRKETKHTAVLECYLSDWRLESVRFRLNEWQSTSSASRSQAFYDFTTLRS